MTKNLISLSFEESAAYYGFTVEEYTIINKIDYRGDFKRAMKQLKDENPVEFQLKLTEYKNQISNNTNVPKCPTCGSTDIKKISGGKRWLTTGIFGLASSDVGKTMQCNSCGAKW